MSVFSFSTNFHQMAADLGKIAGNVQKNEKRAVSLAVQALINDVKPLAPYKTGTYRRSIHAEVVQEGFAWVGYAGSDVQYGRRLEFGFVGADSRGRVYNQRAQPHWRPVWDNNLARYQSILLDALDGGRT